jgi:hypothetical protein
MPPLEDSEYRSPLADESPRKRRARYKIRSVFEKQPDYARVPFIQCDFKWHRSNVDPFVYQQSHQILAVDANCLRQQLGKLL